MGHPEVPEGAAADVATKPTLSRADLVQLRRAAGAGWAVPDRARDEAVFQAMVALTKGRPRERIAALRCLIAMDRADADAAYLAARTAPAPAPSPALAPAPGGGEAA